MERADFRGVPLRAQGNHPSSVRAALHRHLRNAGQRLTIAAGTSCQIAHHENIGEAGNGEIGFDRNTTAPVSGHVRSLGKHSAESTRMHAAGPQHGLGSEPLRISMLVLESDTIAIYF